MLRMRKRICPGINPYVACAGDWRALQHALPLLGNGSTSEVLENYDYGSGDLENQ